MNKQKRLDEENLADEETQEKTEDSLKRSSSTQTVFAQERMEQCKVICIEVLTGVSG